MSATDEIMADIPLQQLASQLGVDEETAAAATRQAIPALLGGMQANAEDPAGAASLAGALDQHSSALVDGGVDLDEVDTDDGDKIVSHVFGPQRSEVAQALGGNLGQQGGLIQKLLPILAPIVLSYLAKRLSGAGQPADDQRGADQQGAGQQGGILGDLLGSMLGGGGSGSSGSIGDLLGGLLGGGRR